MITFYQWLIKENQPTENITVDMTAYDAAIKAAIKKAEAYSQENSERLRQFQYDPRIIANSQYPEKEALMAKFSQTPNPDEDDDDEETSLRSQMSRLSKWYFANSRKNFDPNNRAFWNHALDHHTKLSGNWEHNPADYTDLYKNLIHKSIQNIEATKQQISSLINSIDTWSGSPVRIQAQADYSAYNTSEIALEPATSCHIYVGNREGMFSYFIDEENNKPIVDDIIEGGEDDEEFFDNNQVKSDYYLLINEIRNPGSSSKGKMLTLYTARPIKDREFFKNTTWLPINLFLTNSLNHADGLAHDLGSNEVRDIWIIRMDSRYLTQTLDGPVKYYMVSKDKSPIKSISMY